MRKTLLLILLFTGLPAAQAEVYSRAEAMALAQNPAVDGYVAQLLSLSQSKASGTLSARVHELINDKSLSMPARERALHDFAFNARGFERSADLDAVLVDLEQYNSQVLVPHLAGHGRHNTPLFTVKTAAAGTRNHWTFQEARAATKAMLATTTGSELAHHVMGLQGTSRKGALLALRQADVETLRTQRNDLAKALSADPSLAPVASVVAMRLQDASLAKAVIATGDADTSVLLVQSVPTLFEAQQAYSLLSDAVAIEGAASAAITAMGQLPRADQIDAFLLSQLGVDHTGASAALALSRHGDAGTRNALAQIATESGLRGLHAALALKLDGSAEARALLADLKTNPVASADVKKEVTKWVSQ